MEVQRRDGSDDATDDDCSISVNDCSVASPGATCLTSIKKPDLVWIAGWHPAVIARHSFSCHCEDPDLGRSVGRPVGLDLGGAKNPSEILRFPFASLRASARSDNSNSASLRASARSDMKSADFWGEPADSWS